jgi:putative phage-type endonuclease
MPVTETQLVRRKNHVGASDAPAILGLSPWKSAYDVWADKVGLLEPAEASEAAEAGNFLEDGILARAEKTLGKLIRNQYRVAPGALPIGANLDALVMAPIEGVSSEGDNVEAKTAGLFGPLVDQWGEPGTDQVPPMYIVQAQVQMLCAECDVTHLQAFLGGRGFQLYRIPRNEELLKIIIDRCVSFWRHVEDNIPPVDSAMTIDTIKRIHRQPNKVITFGEAGVVAVKQWQEASEAASAAKKAADAARDRMLTLLGDAEAATLPTGEVLEYMTTKRAGYTVAACEYRTPKIKKGKATK